MAKTIEGEFDIQKDSAGEWRWVKTEPNSGKVLAKATEGYANRQDCEDNASRFGYKGMFVFSTQDKWSFYRDENGEWRWRRKAGNGEIVGASHQGYEEKKDCTWNARINGCPKDQF